LEGSWLLGFGFGGDTGAEKIFVRKNIGQKCRGKANLNICKALQLQGGNGLDFAVDEVDFLGIY
jgi:hypothetical protein